MKYFALLICALTLQACSADMYEDGTLTQHRVKVIEDHYHMRYDLVELNLRSIQNHYAEHGEGSVQLVGIYDPHTNSKALVTSSLRTLSVALENQGANVHTELIPLAEHSSVSIQYQTVQARAPKHCTTMAGYRNTDIGNNTNYNIGCTLETLIAKQVSNPRDLLGNSEMSSTGQARSSANIINAYALGGQNEPLGGYQASSE